MGLGWVRVSAGRPWVGFWLGGRVLGAVLGLGLVSVWFRLAFGLCFLAYVMGGFWVSGLFFCFWFRVWFFFEGFFCLWGGLPGLPRFCFFSCVSGFSGPWFSVIDPFFASSRVLGIRLLLILFWRRAFFALLSPPSCAGLRSRLLPLSPAALLPFEIKS